MCQEVGLQLISPLWHEKPEQILRELLERKIKVLIVGVAAQGLEKNWLGKELTSESVNELIVIGKKFGVHVCGEGGEFESMVIDSKIHKKKIEIQESKIIWNKTNGILQINKLKLVDKQK